MAESQLISNKWKIISLLGRGGMGAVYEVVHKELGFRRALKQLHNHLAENAEIRRRFIEEAQMEAHLEHPHVVRVFDIDTDPAFGTYLVMELVKGPDLGKIIQQNGALDVREVVRIGKEIADALDHAHNLQPRPIVHRDIKPVNILIEEDTGRAVVTDFGIAKQLRVEGEETHTQTGHFVGTYRYSSPEQIRSDKRTPVDARADIYSLGVVLCEMYAGKRYLADMGEMEIASHVAFQADFAPQLDFPEPVNERLHRLILECLERDRDKRIHSARVLMQRLDECLQGVEAIEVRTVPPRAEPPLQPQMVAAGGAAGGVVVGVATVVAAEPETISATPPEAVLPPEEDSTARARRIAAEAEAARIAELIEGVRGEVKERTGQLPRLQSAFVAFGGSVQASHRVTDVAERLRDIETLEGQDELASALASLEALNDRLAQAGSALTVALREAAGLAVAELDAQWNNLRPQTGDFLAAADAGTIQRDIQRSHDCLAAEEWADCQRAIADSRSVLARAATAGHDRAAVAINGLLSQADSAVEELVTLLPPNTSVDVDVAQLRTEVTGYLEAGRLLDAQRGAQTAVAALRERLSQAQTALSLEAEHQRDAARTIERRIDELGATRPQRSTGARLMQEADAALGRRQWRAARDAYAKASEAFTALEEQLRMQREEQGTVAAASRLQQLMQSLDLPAAQAAAPDALKQAQAQEQRALGLRQQQHWAEAVAAYDEAVAAYEAVRSRLIEAQSVQYAQQVDALKERFEQTADVPAPVIAPARQQAEALLKAGKPADLSAGLAALQAASAALTAAQADVPLYTAALEQRTASAACHTRVAALEPTRQQLRQPDRLMQEAATAFEQRQWAAARDTYARGLDALTALERELQTQQEAAQTTAARSRVEPLRASLDIEAAKQWAREALSEAEQAFAAGQEAEKRGDHPSAAAGFEHAFTAYQAVDAQVGQEYGRHRQEAETHLRAALEQAASAPAAVVEEARKRAQAALTATQQRPPKEALPLLEQASASLDGVLTQLPAFKAATERYAAAEELQRRVATLRPSRAQRKPTDALLRDAAAKLKTHDWSSAYDVAGKAVEAFTALEQSLRSAQAAGGTTAATPGIGIGVWIGGAAAVVAIAVGVWWTISKPSPQPVETAKVTTKEAAPKEAAPKEVAPKALPPKAVPPQEAAPKEAAAPPVPGPVLIKSFAPDSARATVRENASQPFSIAVADATAAQAGIRWLLDGKEVASDAPRWEYRPNYDAAGDHKVSVTVGGGLQDGQAHEWQVQVEDVNRPPTLKTEPGAKIDAKVGDTIELKAEAADPDKDTLTYAWAVDGKRVDGSEPAFKLKVAGTQTVALTVSDGKDTVKANWQIATAKVPAFAFDVTPKVIERLPFNGSQEFALVAPRDLPLAGVKYAWAVDGQSASDGPKFTLKATDRALVRDTPVRVSATATDTQGKTFSHEWKVNVLPTVPDIAASSPSGGTVEGDSGRALPFEVTAGAALGNQKFTYIYKVDGKEAARGASPRFEFKPTDEQDHEIVASIEDNFGQASKQRVSWKVSSSGMEAKVKGWLAQYQEARKTKNATKEGELRGLSSAQVAKLADAYSKQNNLQVSFTSARIERLDNARAKASFEMSQNFTGPDGSVQSTRLACQHTLRVADGKVTDVTAEVRPQGPCAPIP